MTDQITDTIFMVRPVAFQLNEETAVNNLFQPREQGISDTRAQNLALEEFDIMVKNLRSHDIEVIVFNDTESISTPDSIFPNNWISLHDDARIVLYPMFAENRRKERREDIIKILSETFEVKKISSFTDWEAKEKYLEGTGSLILDRQNKIAFAAISDRTHPDVMEDFAKNTGYEIVSFTANQTFEGRRLPIYHTNVMMCIGDGFCVICLDTIDSIDERENVVEKLEETGKEIIEISEEQMNNFAGNMLHVKNKNQENFVVMSEAAYKSLEIAQIKQLEKYGKLLHSSIETIERLGGGSARCMMAEVFLPKRITA